MQGEKERYKELILKLSIGLLDNEIDLYEKYLRDRYRKYIKGEIKNNNHDIDMIEGYHGWSVEHTKTLRYEFLDYLNSDPNANYCEDQFSSWLIEQVVGR